MLTGYEGAAPVVFERRLPSGETEQVRLDATVLMISPTGKARDVADPRPVLAAALAHWIAEATDARSYAETIISGEPSRSTLSTPEEVPMV